MMKKRHKKNQRIIKASLLIYCVFLFLALLSMMVFADNPQKSERQIILIDVKGVINPFTAKYILRGIDTAERHNAQLIIIRMDTPGGLDTSMREIDSAILNADVPVAVFIGPKGARSASAGVFITYASDIAAMAPGTNIGAAHPVELGGGGGGDEGDQNWIKKLLEMYEQKKKEEEGTKESKPSESPTSEKPPESEKSESKPSVGSAQAMIEKITNDAVAYIKAMADLKGRNAEWGEKAVRESVSITSSEALNLGVIEYIAIDINDLLKQINGKTIQKNDKTFVIQTEGITPKEVPMSAIESFMLMITNPQVAYLLFIIGIYGLIYELAHPGAILPGVIGGTSLMLAILAFNYLPITAVGVVLILLGIAFMIAELKVPGVGILAVGGIICFILGSFLLIDRNYGEMVIRPGTYIPMAALSVVLFLIVLPRIWRALKGKVATGVSGIMGNVGVVTTELAPAGKVHVHGEYWDARSEDDSVIPKNSKVIVVRKIPEEMLLIVKPKNHDWSKSNMPQI